MIHFYLGFHALIHNLEGIKLQGFSKIKDLNNPKEYYNQINFEKQIWEFGC